MVNRLSCGDHFEMYRNFESLLYNRNQHSVCWSQLYFKNKLIEKEVGVREGELNEGGQKIQTSGYKEELRT